MREGETKMNAYNIQLKSKKQNLHYTNNGFTLIELMIAIALSLVLTAVVIQSYLSNKQTYRLTEGVSRVQESIRFGTHFLSTDIRKTGNIGCIETIRDMVSTPALANPLIDLQTPIVGWDYPGTGDNATDLSLAANAEVDQNTSNLNNGANAPAPAILNGNTVKGSDIILIKKLKRSNFVIAQSNDIKSTSLATINSAVKHNIKQGQMFLVGDCLSADYARQSSQSNNTLDVTTGGGNTFNADHVFSYTWGPSSTISKVVMELYYVGLGASGLPSLFRRQLNGTVASDPIELVEGIETLQILYGLDTDPRQDGAGFDVITSGIPQRFVSADNVTDWSQVVSVRFSMLVRSPENATSEDQDNIAGQGKYKLLGKLNVQPGGGANDNLIRYVVNSTVKPRNTGTNSTRPLGVCPATDQITIQTETGPKTIDCDTFRMTTP